MFNFGVFLYYLAIPALLTTWVLGWPMWTMFAAPTALFVVGFSLMGLDGLLDLPPEPTQDDLDFKRDLTRIDALMARLRETRDPAEHARLREELEPLMRRLVIETPPEVGDGSA